ncbi:MAG: hypothetical protein NTX79_03345 [Candidatus Micrarchaeota archaeon]|nr:hypothetical protein [Candidatus Micrarchaeota archaeon]
MANKIYLVYDFEELCGVFSSLSLARKAVAEHLSHIKKYTQEKSERLGFGDVEFEVFEDQGERRWIFALLAKTKRDKRDLHRRRVAIYQYNQDEYYSSMKRLAEQKTSVPILLSEGRGFEAKAPALRNKG